jgi:DNA transposition AAA+ family ATPase
MPSRDHSSQHNKDSTLRALAKDLLLAIEEQQPHRLASTHHRLAKRAAESIASHATQLILVDEAEQLKESGLAFLYSLSGETGLPIILVGDERILPMWE